MKKTLVAITAALTLTGIAVIDSTPTQAESVRVIDGDTVAIGDQSIRLVGIDTPEVGQKCAGAATAALKRIVAGGVTVEPSRGTDKYGRTLAYLTVGGSDVGIRMLRLGYAKARYDSRDGYAFHPKEDAYHGAERLTLCNEPTEEDTEQDGDGIPFIATAALLATAADNDFEIDFDSFDHDYSRISLALFFRVTERNEKDAWWENVAKMDRQNRESSGNSGGGVSFKNCTAVRNAGRAPIYPGQAGWQSKFDRDGDGIGCEWN
jgi:hypothetical protein